MSARREGTLFLRHMSGSWAYSVGVSSQYMISAANTVFAPGRCQIGGCSTRYTQTASGRTARGTYRGYQVLIEYRPQLGGHRGGPASVDAEVYGTTRGVQFDMSVVAQFPDPEYQITGDPNFDNRYDVRGAPMSVLRWLFADTELRGRILAVPRIALGLEQEHLRLDGIPLQLDPDMLRAYLDIACLIFERLPLAIERSGALAATGGRSLEFHPEVQARKRNRFTIRFIAISLLALFVAVLLFSSVLGTLLFLWLGT